MQGWYEIAVERDIGLVRLTMGGFFDSATIGSMKAELVGVILALPCPADAHVTLCDIREMKIQSQERVEEFARLVSGDDIRSKRLAFVTGASLARIQAKRLTNRPGVEFFSAPDIALEWLRDPTASISSDNAKAASLAQI